jgi:hypothetical protein
LEPEGPGRQGPDDDGGTGNVVQFPRDWSSPDVPVFPPSLSVDGAPSSPGDDAAPGSLHALRADAFWGEDSASVHEAVQAAAPEPPPQDCGNRVVDRPVSRPVGAPTRPLLRAVSDADLVAHGIPAPPPAWRTAAGSEVPGPPRSPGLRGRRSERDDSADSGTAVPASMFTPARAWRDAARRVPAAGAAAACLALIVLVVALIGSGSSPAPPSHPSVAGVADHPGTAAAGSGLSAAALHGSSGARPSGHARSTRGAGAGAKPSAIRRSSRASRMHLRAASHRASSPSSRGSATSGSARPTSASTGRTSTTSASTLQPAAASTATAVPVRTGTTAPATSGTSNKSSSGGPVGAGAPFGPGHLG